MDTNFTPSDVVSVTPSDTATNYGVGFQVGVAGDVSVESAAGNNTVIPACAAGVQYAIKFNRIRATGTTATGIVIFR